MTTFTLKFFARLREQTNIEQLEVPVEQVSSLKLLLPYLKTIHPEWVAYLDAPLMFAVNQELVTHDCPFNVGDEVAIFPPVTGG